MLIDLLFCNITQCMRCNVRCPLKQGEYISRLHVLINNMDMDLHDFYYYLIISIKWKKT